jgi:hypothetical protein
VPISVEQFIHGLRREIETRSLTLRAGAPELGATVG